MSALLNGVNEVVFLAVAGYLVWSVHKRGVKQ